MDNIAEDTADVQLDTNEQLVVKEQLDVKKQSTLPEQPSIISLLTSPQDQTAHKKEITSKRRRNNIFGELTDYVIMGFLNIGGDGIFYHPTDRCILYGRSASSMYFIMTHPTGKISLDFKVKLAADAKAAGAVPLIAIVESKRVKFLDLKEKKVSYI